MYRAGRVLIRGGVLLAFLAQAAGAAAFCMQPSQPSAPYTQMPSEPFCARGYYNQKCSQLEIDNYRRDVERYLEEMKRYVESVDAYADKAANWAKCQSQEAVGNWNRFARGY